MLREYTTNLVVRDTSGKNEYDKIGYWCFDIELMFFVWILIFSKENELHETQIWICWPLLQPKCVHGQKPTKCDQNCMSHFSGL